MSQSVVYTRPLVIALHELADADFQERSWPDPQCLSSLSEVYEDAFSNSCLDEAMESGSPDSWLLDHDGPSSLDMAPRPAVDRLSRDAGQMLYKLDALLAELCELELSQILTSARLAEAREIARGVLGALGIPGPYAYISPFPRT